MRWPAGAAWTRRRQARPAAGTDPAAGPDCSGRGRDLRGIGRLTRFLHSRYPEAEQTRQLACCSSTWRADSGLRRQAAQSLLRQPLRPAAAIAGIGRGCKPAASAPSPPAPGLGKAAGGQQVGARDMRVVRKRWCRLRNEPRMLRGFVAQQGLGQPFADQRILRADSPP